MPRLRTRASGTGAGWWWAYGASYGLASLSCTIAPFLAVTAFAVQSGDFGAALAAFVAYGLGMGMIVALVSIAVAFAKDTLVTRMRRVLPRVSRASGVLLVLSGGYMAYYGWYELRASTADPVIGLAVRVQATVAAWINSIGPLWIAAVFCSALVLIGVSRHRAGLAKERTAVSPPLTSSGQQVHGAGDGDRGHDEQQGDEHPAHPLLRHAPD